MLAVAVTTLPDEPGWTFEPKWDGYRGIGTIGAGELRIRSRRGTDMAPWFPELAGLADAIGAKRALVDGELIALDPAGHPDFAALQQRMLGRRRPARAGEATAVLYMVFDLLGLDGRLLLDQPWTERRRRLEALGLGGPAWQTSPSYPELGAQVWTATAEQSLEGVVAKRRSSSYRPGRRHPDWRKLTHERHGLLVVGGYVPGAAGVELLLVGSRQPDGRLDHLASVTAGLVPASRRKLATLLAPLHTDASPFTGPIGTGPWGARAPRAQRPQWVRPELEVVVAYRGMEGQQLRHPRYAGLG
jgi:bifunctional non-homologous end joining protein LigD